MINLITSRRIYYNDKLLKMVILFLVIEYPKDEKCGQELVLSVTVVVEDDLVEAGLVEP